MPTVRHAKTPPALPDGGRGSLTPCAEARVTLYNKPIKAFMPTVLLGCATADFFRAGVKWLTGLSQLCP
jgi:hypothetical protein